MATGLHGAAVRLLRMLRKEDQASGISGPRLSALSVLVFGGSTTLAGAAAGGRGQRPPTFGSVGLGVWRVDIACRARRGRAGQAADHVAHRRGAGPERP